MAFIVIGIGYVIVVKYDLFKKIVSLIGIDVNGRSNLYAYLSSYYEISLFYLGKGFSYVDKHMFEATGCATHNTIIRMYAELGCIPCIMWMYWYLVKAPQRIMKIYKDEAGLMLLASTIYLFMTYCIGNSMNLYCIQYSFMLIPIVLSIPRIQTETEKQKLTSKQLIDMRYIKEVR